MYQYLLITQAFAESMDGKASAIVNDVFKYAVTIDGRYVTGINAADNFPEDFETINAEMLMLDITDFPPPPPLDLTVLY